VWLAVNSILPIVIAVCLTGSITAQVRDEVVLYGSSGQTGIDAVLRFNRKLTLLSATPATSPTATLEKVCPIATDGQGRRIVTMAPLGATTLMRIDNEGAVLPSTILAHNPVQVAAAADGRVFALTRIPLLASGPMYGVNSDGSVAWTNLAGPSLFTIVYPRHLCVTAGSQLWMGDTTPPHGQFWGKPLLLRMDPDTGDVLQYLHLPYLGGEGSFDEVTLSPSLVQSSWDFTGRAVEG